MLAVFNICLLLLLGLFAMDQIKPSQGTIDVINNTSNYELWTSNFEYPNESGELTQLIQNYREKIHKEIHDLDLESTKSKIQNGDLDYTSFSTTTSLHKKSVDVSSLFDSTHEISLKEHLEQLNYSDSDIDNFFTPVFEKIEKYENKIINLQDSLVKQTSENAAIKNDIQNILNQITYLNNNNKKLNTEIDNLNDELYYMDCKVIENNQYARRESVIISGIPDNIEQRHLEENVLIILRSIGLSSISSYHISACHRLAKKKNDRYPAQTIVRFTNRKIVHFCLENRNRLLEVKNHLKMNLRFYESLCNENKNAYNDCFDLKKYGLITDYYIRNGFVKIIKNGENRPIKINHPDDLYYYFEDYYKCNELYTTS